MKRLKLKSMLFPLGVRMRSIVMLLVLVAALVVSLILEAGVSYAAVGVIRPDGDVTVTFANCTGANCSSGYYAVVNEASLNTSDYISTGTNGGTGDEVEFSMSSVANPSDIVSRVEVKFQADVAACRVFGAGSCDTLSVRIYINGSYQPAQVFTMSTTNTLYTATFDGDWVGDDDIRVEFVRTEMGTGNADDDVRIYQVYAEVTHEQGIAVGQSAYRWFENTDSTSVGNPLAAQDTAAAITTPGQAFRLRQGLHVSEGTLDQSGRDFRLQYADKGTGTCLLPVNGAPSTYTDVGLGGEWHSPIWDKRNAHQVVEFDGKMWIIGGFSGFTAVGSYDDVWYSTDGLNWTLATDQPGWAGRHQHAVAVYDDRLWVIGGYDESSALSDVWSSSDGVNWTQETGSASFGGRYRSAAVGFNGKLWVLGGYTGSSYTNTIWSSTDGANWTLESNPSWSSRAFHRATVFGGKLWVMGGTNGPFNFNDIYSSTNGTSWTQETSSANWSARQTFGLATANGKMWVLGGYDGARINDVWSSSDGVSWTRSTAAADWAGRSYHEAVGFDNKIWVFGGHDGSNSKNDVWSSSDGVSWTSVAGELGRRQGHMATVHNGEMWVAGGAINISATYLRDVYRSSDGINWVQVTATANWPARMSGVLLSFDNKLWIMGGWNGTTRLNDVWSSSDGVNWTQETSGASWAIRNYFTGTVFDNKMWVMGGLGGTGSTLYNDVWSSSDGVNWTQETGSAGWSARYGSYGTEFNGKLYLTGGGDATITYNDVWSSSDGVNWTQETGNAGWGERLQFSGTVLDGRIWIYGGRQGGDPTATRNDLWSSSDGVNWTQENSSVFPNPRYLVSMMAYDDKVWIMGGEDAIVGTIAEVKYAKDSLITWNRNSTPSHNDALTGNGNDPSHSGHTMVAQSYIEGNPFTNNQAAVYSGQDGLWDFSLKDNGASIESTYCFRIVRDNGAPLDSYAVYPEITINDSGTPPDLPDFMAQVKSSDESTIGVGGWINDDQVTFSALVSDPDSNDLLQLCVEYQPIGTGFSGVDMFCSEDVVYAGTPVSAEVTIDGIAEGEYHWQARVKDENGNHSSWASYGGNAESTLDFGIDTTPPTGAAYDGLSAGVDAMFNDGSLDSLSANWTSNADISGLLGYEYSIGTTIGGADVLGWTSAGTSNSITVDSLNLETSQVYFFNIRIVDNAGNTTTVSTNGVMVAPNLSFSVSTDTIDFEALNASNNYTASQSLSLNAATNAKSGYKIYSRATDFLKSQSLQIIPMFNGGTYSSPAAWGLSTGLGYHSSDVAVGGVNRFNSSPCLGGGSSPCFAPYSTLGIGDVIADNDGPTSGDGYTITTRVSIDAPNQRSGSYHTTILYSAYATF